MNLSSSTKSEASGIYKIIFSIIGVLLFGYIAVRGFKLSFTHDESLTYTILTGKDTWVMTANNHWLNTILAYLLSRIFGYSEWVLRLPNILAFGLYLFYCFKFLTGFSKHWLSVLIFLPIVLLNPFVLDFFSLSRGYGLAMAFLIASLYYCTRALREESYKNLVLFSVFGLLCVYANYSFLMGILAAFAAFFIMQFAGKTDLQLEKEKQYSKAENLNPATSGTYYRYSLLFDLPGNSIFKGLANLITKKDILLYVSFGLGIIPAIINTLELSKRKELYFGGDEGVIKDTLISITASSFYGSAFATYAWLVLCVLAVLFVVGFLVRKNVELWFYLIVILVLIFIPVLLHAIIGMKFPIERSALYWVVIAGLFMLFLSESVLNNSKLTLKVPVILIAALLSLGSVLNFIRSFNLRYTYTWAYDANTRDAVKILSENVDKNVVYKIGVNALFEPAFNYYREIYHYTWLEPIPRDDMKSGYDYYYIKENNFEILKQDCLRELKHYPDTESWLMKKCEADNNQ